MSAIREAAAEELEGLLEVIENAKAEERARISRWLRGKAAAQLEGISLPDRERGDEAVSRADLLRELAGELEREARHGAD